MSVESHARIRRYESVAERLAAGVFDHLDICYRCQCAQHCVWYTAQMEIREVLRRLRLSA
jgi:hypothetical protein